MKVRRSKDVGSWGLTVARGSFNRDEIGPLELEMFEMLLRGSTGLLAELDGQPAGGGAFAVQDGLGLFFSDSTLAAARGKGVHQAVISARLAMAAESGCDLAVVSTAPGSISQRNYEKFGFQVVYTRVVVVNHS